jgi:hypothetical protein
MNEEWRNNAAFFYLEKALIEPLKLVFMTGVKFFVCFYDALGCLSTVKSAG